jgi:phosphatidylserine decarboxylase
VGYLVIILILGIFYRTKDDPIVLNDTHFLAPCGGKIKKIEQKGTRTKIRVFLNIHDQHAQFYPVSGTVTDVQHKLGKFNPAYLLEKTEFNERTITSLQTKNGDTIKVTQIAGQVARRIVNHAKIGSHVKQGDYIGMIKFSSAVDIEFSSDAWQIEAKVGDKLTPLQTILATKR